MFNMPGMFITHGYLPPVKPDKYVHTTITLELCLGTMAQIVRPSWDEFDYTGDIGFLRQKAYPFLKEMALFYAAYVEKGNDGYYHIIPSMEEERWGIYPEFSRNKDIISSLCMFRWGLNKAADAAELLGVDADLSEKWREVAAKIAPNPTWETPGGTILAAMPGFEPVHMKDDHPFEAVSYPTILADEINLDSSKDLRDMMVRTMKTPWTGKTEETLTLLGVPEAPPTGTRRRNTGLNPEALLNSRSGRIHLFPAVPATEVIAFFNFQARGGFLVSACKNAEGIYFLEIESRRDGQCQVMNPWINHEVKIREVGRRKSVPVTIDKKNGECLVFQTSAKSKYQISPV